VADKSEVLSGLRERMPWQVARPILKEIGTPRAMGWENTIARIEDDETITNEQVDELSEALIEHQVTGEKMCRFYQLDDAEIEELRDATEGLEIVEGPMADIYPVPLQEDALANLPADHRELVSVEESGDGLAAVFCSVREKPTRDVIDPDSLPEHLQDYFDEYDELIAYRLDRQQAFDVVWIPEDGNVIDVRTDFPKHTELERARHAQHRLLTGFRDAVGVDPFGEPINLFPIIRDMYGTDAEGRVVELAFGTTTRSLKHEKMRRNRDCLRTETYHVGGKEALATELQLYKVSIAYTYPHSPDFSSHPELSLHSTSLVADNPNPQLFDAVIRKTVGLDDYNHVRERILHFINEFGD